MKEFFLIWKGLGEDWGIFPGYVGKIIDSPTYGEGIELCCQATPGRIGLALRASAFEGPHARGEQQLDKNQ